MSYPLPDHFSYDEYKTAYKKSVEDPEGFWGDIASTFSWRKKWDKVLGMEFQRTKLEWFIGGKAEYHGKLS